jgi:hypothetical protein
MKKETLEEIAKKYYPPYTDGIITDEIRALREGFVKGYEVQAERMYSEEDLRRAYTVGKHGGVNQTYYDFDEWFEQFKKK